MSSVNDPIPTIMSFISLKVIEIQTKVIYFNEPLTMKHRLGKKCQDC